MPIFNSLIMPLKYTIIEDLISRLLADELESQKKIASSSGLTQKEIIRNINFKVFTGRYRAPVIEEMPCVTVITPKLSFDETQSISGLSNNVQISLIFYTTGINSDEKLISADKSADIRMKYLISQTIGILQSQYAESEFTRNGVRQVIFKDCKLIEAPFKNKEIQTVLAYELVIEMMVKEMSEQLTGTKITEFYINYLPAEDFNNPIIKIILEKQSEGK